MKKNLFKGLENDKSFIKKLYEQKTDEGIRNVFKEKNIVLSDQDLKDLKALIVISTNNGGELSDEIIENISGGGIKNWISNNWHRMIGVACGVTATASLIYEGNSIRKDISSGINSAIGTVDSAANSAIDNASRILGEKTGKLVNIVDRARVDLAEGGYTQLAFGAAMGLPMGGKMAWNMKTD